MEVVRTGYQKVMIIIKALIGDNVVDIGRLSWGSKGLLWERGKKKKEDKDGIEGLEEVGE